MKISLFLLSSLTVMTSSLGAANYYYNSDEATQAPASSYQKDQSSQDANMQKSSGGNNYYYQEQGQGSYESGNYQNPIEDTEKKTLMKPASIEGQNPQAKKGATKSEFIETPPSNLTSQYQRPTLELSDRDLLAKIMDKVEENNKSDNWNSINIKIFKGIVSLTGTVGSEQDRRDVEVVIRKIAGVKGVDNKIKLAVKEDQSNHYSDNYNPNSYQAKNERALETQQQSQQAAPEMSDMDRKIQQKIKDALKGGFFSRGYEGVRANVQNGNVILTGTVESKRDLEKVIKIVENIDGVQNVVNQINIK